METKSDYVVLSSEIYAECLLWGENLAAHYAEGGSPQSLAFSSHGMERNSVGLAASKVAECVFALAFNLDPMIQLDWDVSRPDKGYDIIIGRTLVDVKQVDPTDRYLVWPVRKTPIFDDKHFHVLAAVETEEQIGRCRGWVGKKTFRRRRLIAEEGHKLSPGTRHMLIVDLHRMGVFPGHSDDPREHYCWCGEPGVFGNQRGFFCGEHR